MHAALDVTDTADAEADSIGQRDLRQAARHAILLEEIPKSGRLIHDHGHCAAKPCRVRALLLSSPLLEQRGALSP